MLERLKSAIIEAFSGVGREPSLNDKENDMTVTKEQFDALSEKVDALSDGIGEAVANAISTAVKPLTENLEAVQNAQKEKDAAELAGHVETIVKANLMDEETAKELTLNAARKLAEKAKPGKAAPLNGAPVVNTNSGGFKLPKAED
jgi:hypothetical protein